MPTTTRTDRLMRRANTDTQTAGAVAATGGN